MNREPYEIKSDAKSIIRSNIGPVLLATIIYLALQYVMGLLTSRLSGYSEFAKQYYNVLVSGAEPTLLPWPQVKPAAGILAAAVYLMSMVFTAGYVRYTLLLSRGEHVNVMTVFESLGWFGKVFVIQLIRGVLIGLGLLFFTVPGFMLMYRYRLALFVMYDHPEMGPVQCLRESARLMHGNKNRFFRLDLTFLGWFILSEFVTAAAAPLLEIWVQPYWGTSCSIFYNDMIGVKSRAEEKPPRDDDDIDF